MDVGFWALVPPVLTIALAIITKEVLLSLFVGVFLGCMILMDWNFIGALEQMFRLIMGETAADGVSVIPGALNSVGHLQVVIIVTLLGGIIGLLVRSGGSAAFGNMLGNKIQTKKGAQLCTWAIGLLIFFDDYFNALTNGAVMRPVSDKFGVSREKLSYIIDSTAVGVCLIVPASSWVAFLCSLIGGSFETAGIKQDSFRTFLSVIPYNYYAWLSIIMVLFVILMGIDFGPMAKAEKRTRETGVLCNRSFSGGDSDEDDYSSIPVAEGGKPMDLLIPIIFLVAMALVFMLYTGGFFTNHSIMETINNMDGTRALCYAFGCALIFAIAFYSIRKLSTITESMAAVVVGAKSMLYVIILLTFAWCIGLISEKLNTAGFIADLFVGNVPVWIVPLILFIFACAMTFATGATWGTYAIMIPLAIPLAVAMDLNAYVCIAAVIGGGGFGNHCSPLADTAILSSAASNIRHTDHIKTQIPYSLTCATAASIGYIASGFIDGWVVPLLVAFGAFFILVFILNKFFGTNKYSLEEVTAEIESEI